MNIMEEIKKYLKGRNPVPLLCALGGMGVLLMSTPGDSREDSPVEESLTQVREPRDIEGELSDLLSSVEGAGKVRLMITYRNEGTVVLAENRVNEEGPEDKRQESTVVLGDDDKPLVLSQGSPEIEGVLIVAQGGGNVKVRDSLIRATQALLGVDINKVEVLTMEGE